MSFSGDGIRHVITLVLFTYKRIFLMKLFEYEVKSKLTILPVLPLCESEKCSSSLEDRV